RLCYAMVSEEQMRLFIAVEIDDANKSRLAKIREELRFNSSQGSYTLTENFHLTLAFLGETDVSNIPMITDAMDRVEFSPFMMKLTHLGAFRRPNGDLWWIGIDSSEQVKQLQCRLKESLFSKGIWFDPKPFVPHLTLARSVRLNRSLEMKSLLSRKVDISLSVRQISLMQSDRVDGKLVYIPLHTTRVQNLS
ncbi:MAG: RNA 2',3'-cyclic phosphodiesterase, partial [Sphaerochaetaceae bacterium]|nr:RNA 2',3'-cyclic phosphodiesterase [Sphaerochaetaceae bacterium]